MIRNLYIVLLFACIPVFITGCGTAANNITYKKYNGPGTCNYESYNSSELEFIEIPQKYQHYGYQLIYSNIENITKHIPYADFVGKKSKVIGMVNDHFKQKHFEILVENCELVYSSAYMQTMDDSNDIRGLFPVQKFEDAKKLIGETIVVNRGGIGRFYNNIIYANEDNDNGIIYPAYFEQVKVIHAFAKQIRASKIWLVVKRESGEKGLMIYETKAIHHIIDKSMIGREITIGMNSMDTIKICGYPEKVNTTVNQGGTFEQWIYGDVYLYFENNTLVSYQM